LYAYSWYKGKSTLSLLDSNGDSKWQYSTAGSSFNSYRYMIKYKEIDALNDMIIATSGHNTIIYNKIISSSTSPYTVSVTESKTLRDIKVAISRKLYGLYIVDQNNLVSLIVDPNPLD
jgi:hypothetical protein